MAVIFIVLNFTNNYIVSGVRYMEGFGHYEKVTAVGFKLFLFYFFLYTIISFILLLYDYTKNDGIRRRQIFYLILASIIGFVGGTSNFVTDLTGIYPYGQIIVWLYPILITYGIFMDEIKFKIKF